MPRLNRDLERRLAARRERERRRTPTERRYRFVGSPTVADGAMEDAPTGVADLDLEPGLEAAPALPRGVRQVGSARAPIARQAPRPFSAYGADYAYVLQDLRRIALVVGVILLLIVVLALLFGR